jgi:Glycosyltransferase family 20
VLEELDQAPGQVWIHDFHLALLPALIKAERPTAPVSVFWHIPWPSPDVWRILPERREVLDCWRPMPLCSRLLVSLANTKAVEDLLCDLADWLEHL